MSDTNESERVDKQPVADGDHLPEAGGVSRLDSPCRQVRVHLLPEFTDPHELAGNCVVVVDILRASTTLAAALNARVATIVPCLEVSEARQLAAQRRDRGVDVVLGGERGGRRLEGFDFGNSPVEYSADRLEGRTLIFTTTNGTRAMMRCIGAGRVLIGSFVNLSATVTAIDHAEPACVDILCAGTDGQVSWEDTLFAGALVARLRALQFAVCQDGAVIAESAWRQIGGSKLGATGLAEAFRCGRGAQNLLAIDRDEDLEWAADIDRLDVVPELDLSSWEILSFRHA